MRVKKNDYSVIPVPWAAGVLRRTFGSLQHIRGIPRLLWWTRHLAFPSGPILVDTPDGLPITIDPDDYGQLMLFYFDYCPELQALMADVLRPGDLCLDLGANVGVLTVKMAELVSPGGKVIAVELNAKVASQLQATIESRYSDLVKVVVRGIARTPGMGNIECHPGGFSESVEVTKIINHPGCVDQPNTLTTIDIIVKSFTPQRTPDFIKVDIEGSEVELLESMESLMGSGARPMLLVEFHPEKCLKRGCNVEGIWEQLWAIGYSGRTVDSVGISYRLRDKSSVSLGRENVLFTTSAHLSERPKLAKPWADANSI